MNRIKIYEVSFLLDGKYQTQFVETLLSEEEIKKWCLNNYKQIYILSISEFNNILNSGQTFIRI